MDEQIRRARGRRPCPRSRTAVGFTLIELSIAMATVATIAFIGVPAMVDVVLSARVKSAAQDFYSTAVYARNEAVKRGATVQLTRTGTSWAEGWQVKTGNTLLWSQGAYSAVVVADPVPDTFTYRRDGWLEGAGAYSVNFSVPGNARVPMRCVVVRPGGRPYLLVDKDRKGRCEA